MQVDGIEVPDGLRVSFRHLRWPRGPAVIFGKRPAREISDAGGTVDPRGGETIASLFDAGTGELVMTGAARCNPTDNYRKVTGRRMALGRALHALDLKRRRLTVSGQVRTSLGLPK